jgi:hypothetical protein
MKGRLKMKRIKFDDMKMQINGLPWYEHNGKKFWRLPLELEDAAPEGVWALSKQASGARIRFRSDARTFGMKVLYKELFQRPNISRIGNMGIDLYIDGEFWNVIYPMQENEIEQYFFENVEKKFREYTLYLPYVSEAPEILEFIMDDAAVIESPSGFALEKPVVFYGTSITHGACASRCGLTYAARLARALNIDFVNLGFSSSGKGEKCMAETAAQIDAACYVLDFAVNNDSAEELEAAYYPFISAIRAANKETPILLVTNIFDSKELWMPPNPDCEIVAFRDAKRRYSGFREVIRRAYDKCISQGDKNIYIVEGLDLISFDDGDCLVDGTHPNDAGFEKMAEGIGNRLKEILRL